MAGHESEERELARRFEQHRGRLRAVAYRMLGSLSEADDAVQETWLRLAGTRDQEIENLGGWLTTVTGRICLTKRSPATHLTHRPPRLARHDPPQLHLRLTRLGLACLPGTIMVGETVAGWSVFVDGSVLKPGLAGYRSYIHGLVGELARRGIDVTVATSYPEELGATGARVVPLRPIVRRWQGRAAWRQTRLSHLLGRVRPDVLLAPVPELPSRHVRVPTVAVVHDVSPLVAPALYGRRAWLRYRIGLRLLARSADAIVCLSDATRRGVCEHTDVDVRRCQVIGQGPQHWNGAQPAPGETVESASGHTRLLYVGTLLRHKNVETLAQAIGDSELGLTTTLDLVGPISTKQRRRLDALRATLRFPESICHHGFVDGHSLGAYYSQATGVVLPSLIEGFGLSVLEGMTLGVPVIASDIPAVREVGGDAVAYVATPLSPESWRHAVSSALGDAARRRKQIELGKIRARLFTWERVGDRFEDLLSRLVSERQSGPARPASPHRSS